MKPKTTRVIMAIAIWVLGLAGLTWYLAGQQSAGDHTLADAALRDARLRYTAAASDPRGPTSQINAGKYIVSAEGVDLFLASETAVRQPHITLHLERLTLALDATYELTLLSNVGRATPLLRYVPDASAAVKEFPGLAALVVGGPEGPVMDNSDGRAVKALTKVAAAELQFARREVTRTWGP